MEKAYWLSAGFFEIGAECCWVRGQTRALRRCGPLQCKGCSGRRLCTGLGSGLASPIAVASESSVQRPKTMFEGPQIPGVFAVGLLIVALVAWQKLLRGPPLQPLDGRVPADEPR
jgi:hypothetical protein